MFIPYNSPAGNYMLKLVARFPGKPPQIMARRFSSMTELKTSVNNIIDKARNVKVIDAGRITGYEACVIDARERFKQCGEISLFRRLTSWKP